MLSLCLKNPSRCKPVFQDNFDMNQYMTFDNQQVMNVKLLNKWDEDHLYPKKAMKSMKIKQRVSCYLEQSSLDKMKYKALITNKMASIKRFQINKKLKDLSTIIQQKTTNDKWKNCNVSQTYGFNFNAFLQKETKGTDNNVSDDSYIKKTNDNDMFFGLDDIKFQIRSKMQLEKTYQSEITSIIKELNNNKDKISILHNEQNTIHRQIEEKKQKYMESKDTLAIIEKEYLRPDNQLSIFRGIQRQNIQKINEHLKEVETEYFMSTNLNNHRLKEINQELSELKYEIITLNEFKKENLKCLIDYYLDILSQGIDVREVGLVWVIIRLYELNVHLSVNNFPKILDYISVRYLIEYSEKVFLLKKMKILIDVIKIKYKKANAGFEEEMKLNAKKAANGLSLTHSSGLGNERGEDIYMLISDHQTECDKVELLQAEIKKALRSQYNIMNNKRQHQSFTLTYLKRTSQCELKSNFNKDNNHYLLDDLTDLRNIILKIEKEIKAMKSSYQKYFKSKYDPIKLKGLNECAKYDLMFKALFGNHTLL